MAMKHTAALWLLGAALGIGACSAAGDASSGYAGGGSGTSGDGSTDGGYAHPIPGHDTDAEPDAPTTCGWQPYDDGLVGGYVSDVAYDPRTPGVAWATSADHLYKSADHGATWALVSVAPLTFNQLALPSDSPDHILAAANGGVLASTDGGATWTVALGGLSPISILSHPANPLRVYVGTLGGGILRSDDGGRSFSPADYGLPYGGIVWLDGDPTNVDGVLATAAIIGASGTYSDAGAILRTVDGGATWTTSSSAFRISWRFSRCASTPTTLYAASFDGLLTSVDNGSTWSSLLSAFNDIDVVLAPSDCGTLYNTVFGTGMSRSADGAATFAGPLMHGIPFADAFPRKVAVDPSDKTRILGTTPGGLLYSTDAGDDWTLVGGAMGLDVSSLATSPTDPGRLWMSTWGAQAFVRDGAAPWTRVPLAVDYQFVVAPDPAIANRTLFGTWPNVESTTDGVTFTQGSVDTNPMALAFDPSNSQVVYAATEVGGVFKSIDGGATWTAASTDIPPWSDGLGTNSNVDVRAIAVDATAPRRVLLGAYENGLWVSNDGAASWTQGSALTAFSWTGFAELRGGTPALFATVAGHGVQTSTDGGVTWSDASAGLPTQDVQALVADSFGGGLYASTGNGVYRSTDRGATWVGLDTACSPRGGTTKEAIVTTSAGPELAAVAAGGFGVFVHPL
jgi:hypothetical protein